MQRQTCDTDTEQRTDAGPARVGEAEAQTDARPALDGRDVPLAADFGIVVGYSKVADTPEFREAVEGDGRKSMMWSVLIGLALPILVGGLLSLVRRNGSYMAISFLLEPVVMGVVVYTHVQQGLAKPWEGVVEARRVRHRKGTTWHEIVCTTLEGKTKKVREYGTHPLYDYLREGDRVRFHPRLAAGLEKYDKTADEYLVCPFCGRKNPLDVHECEACARPLLR